MKHRKQKQKSKKEQKRARVTYYHDPVPVPPGTQAPNEEGDVVLDVPDDFWGRKEDDQKDYLEPLVERHLGHDRYLIDFWEPEPTSGLLIAVDGTTKPVALTIEELEAAVGGQVEFLKFPDGSSLVLNAHGQIHGLPVNPIATDLAGGEIVGNVVVVR